MATIDVGVRVNLEESSLRSLQQDLTRAVQTINPQLSVDIDEAGLRRLLENQPGARLRIQGVNFGREANAAIERFLENRVVEIAGFRRGDLQRLRREIEQQIGRIELATAGRADIGRQLAQAQQRLAGGGFGDPLAGGIDVRQVQAEVDELQSQFEQAGRDVQSQRDTLDRLFRELVQNQQAQAQFAQRAAREQEEIARRFAEFQLTQQESNQDIQNFRAINRRVLANQGQVDVSSREIRDALRERASTERELAARARELLASSALPSELETESRTQDVDERLARERARSLSDATRREFDAIIESAEAGGRLAVELDRAARDQRARTEEARRNNLLPTIISAQERIGRGLQIEARLIEERVRQQQELPQGPVLPPGGGGPPPTIENIDAIQEEIGRNLQIDARLIAERARLDAEANARKQAVLREEQRLERQRLAELEEETKRGEQLTERRIAALTQSLQQQLRASTFARRGADLERTLSEVLQERVNRERRLRPQDQEVTGLGSRTRQVLERASLRLARSILSAADSVRDAFGRRLFDFTNPTQIQRIQNRFSSALSRSAGQARDYAEELGRGTLAIRNLQRIREREATALQNQVRTTNDLTNRIAGLNTAIAATRVGANFERVVELGDERLRLETRLNNASGAVLQTRQRIANIDQQIADARRRALQQARSEASGRGRGGGQQQQGNTVTFRGAGDIVNFARRLPTAQLDLFSRTLLNVRDAGQNAGRGIQRFNATLRQGQPIVDRLRNNLTLANREVFEFGVRTAQAARRLLEWATPAQFIFQTIGRLQQAVDVLTDLDVQARRLVFFSPDSPIEAASDATTELNRSLGQTQQNLEAFLDVSGRLGLATSDVAEALVTAARVGTPLAQSLSEAADGSAQLEAGLVRSTLQLVRLEQGSLSAETAVRRLRAIQSQFLDTLQLSEGVVPQAVENIGNLLAEAAANSTFNVNELANAVTRLGTSFAQLGDANLPATISIIAEVARTTGAEVGRIATTFRQLTTLTVQNAEELRRAFNIDIIDPDTGQQTFQGILDFLNEVNRLSRADPERGAQLARLGTDRRNVNEVRQFAAAVSRLQDTFGDLNSEQAQVEIAGRAAVRAFEAERLLADSLQGSFNRLDTAFQDLTNTLLQSSAFTSIVDLAVDAVNGIESLIDSVTSVQPVFAALGTFILGQLLPRLATAFVGFGATLLDAFTGRGAQRELTRLFSTTQTGIQGVNRARTEGLISAREQRRISLQLIAAQQELALAEVQVQRAIQQQNLAKQRQEALNAGNVGLVRQLEAAENRLNAAIQRENSLRQQTAQSLTNQRAGFFSSSRLAALGSAAVVAGGFLAQQLATGVEGESDSVGNTISSALTAGIPGALVGAQIGSLIAPGIGTAIGAGIGGIASATFAAFETSRREQDRLEQEAENNAEAERRREAARAAQRRVARAQAARLAESASERTRAEERTLRITQEVANAQRAVQEAEGDQESQLAAITRLSRLQVQLEEAKSAQKREQLEIENRQLQNAAEINRLRRQEQDALQRISLLKELAILGLEEEQAIPIGIEFDQQAIARQIDTVRDQIELELSRQTTIELQTDTRAFEQSRQRVLDLQARERQLQIQAVQQEIQARRRLQDRQSRLVEQEINGLTRAGESFGTAIQEAFTSQLRVADAILEAGNVAAQALANRGRDFLAQLEASGAEVTVRLRALQRQTTRELARLRANQALAEQALTSTGVQAFSNAGEIDDALRRTARELRQAGRRAADDIFDGLRGEFDVDLFIQRERARLTQQEFNQRLAQTRTELNIRQQILNSEVQLLQQRISAERELRDLRVEQQREFGRVLLQGPEEFQQVVGNIQNASRFFEDVRGLDVRSLQRIADRAVELRARGRFDILRSVQQGLQSLISTGGARVIGAATNEQLLRIFEQTVTSGLPGGTSPEEVALQLQRQAEEAAAQTREQQALRQRQEELQRLAFRQAQLQETEARLAGESALIAGRQRDQLLTSAQARFQELVQIKTALVGIQTNGVRVAQGGTAAERGTSRRDEQENSRTVGAEVARQLLPVVDSLPREFANLVNRATANIPGGAVERDRAEARQQLEPIFQELINLNALQLERALESAAEAGTAEERRVAEDAARTRAARQLQLLRTADPLDTNFADALDSLADNILEARGEGRGLGDVLPDFEELIRGFSASEQQAFRLAEAQRLAADRAELNRRRSELQARFFERETALRRRQLEERVALNRANQEAGLTIQEVTRRRRALISQQQAERRALAREFDNARVSTAGLADEAINLRTQVRQAITVFGQLEGVIGGIAGRPGAPGDDFRDLPQGVRPGFDTPRADEIAGLRQNLGFDRVIRDFFDNLELRQGQGFVAVPREVSRLREAIDAQRELVAAARAEAEAQPRDAAARQEFNRQRNLLNRQERELRAAERRTPEEALGTRFAGERGARQLLEDPLARAGVVGGFRELLQGNTDFIRELRSLTQTEEGGARVRFRQRRELDVERLTDLLQDAGLGGVAGGIEGNRNRAARVAERLLRLSQTLERNQGPLSPRQLRQLADILGQEFTGAFEGVAEAQQNANRDLVNALQGRGAGESAQEFSQRRRREEAEAFAQAARQAIEGINQEVFQEAATAVGEQIAGQVAQASLDTAEELRRQLERLQEIRVGFQDNLAVQVEAQVQNNLRVDQRFTDALREIFPNIDDAQFNALVTTVAALATVERNRGTSLPPEAGDLQPPGNQ